MHVGEMRRVQKSEVFTPLSGSATGAITTPLCTVSRPDGTTVSATTTAAPNTGLVPGQTYNVTVNPYTFDLGGGYVFAMSWVLDGETLHGVRGVFAAWTDVYTAIRAELQTTTVLLPDEVIDYALVGMQRKLEALFPSLGQYGSLVGLDQSYIDYALIYLACIRLTVSQVNVGPEGELIAYQFQQTKYTFNPAKRIGTKSRNDEWFELAYEYFGRIASIASFFTAKTNRFQFFTIDGPSRQSIVDFGRQSLFGNTARLLTDVVNFTGW